MTFEKALEAMRNGYEVKRKIWNENTVLGLDAGGERFYVYNTKHPEFSTYCNYDIAADDWEIECKEPKISKNAFVNMPFTPGNENLIKEIVRDHELLKQITETEESEMYSVLEITFKSGDTIAYSKDEWDDYAYDGTAISVKKGSVWIGIYNFENVFSVELKK